VYLRTNHGRIVLALALAGILAGCTDMDSGWFSKPVNLFGNGNLSYSYSQLGATKQERRITADDLVDANGACPRFASPAPAAPVNPDGSPAGPLGTASQLGGGIGIGMSECEVVSRIGAPSGVDLGRNPNGDRTAVLTFQAGPRPGIYRFVGGKLTEMDRVAEAPPPPQPEKPAKPVKKKAAKAKKPPKADNNTGAPPASRGTQ
jgi:hypothetical protein